MVRWRCQATPVRGCSRWEGRSPQPHRACVTRLQDNLAGLIAITRALTWAADDPVANPILPIGEHSRPICIRYDNEYAAMIATGVWKGKKHKDAAPLVQRAWKRLKALRGERL